MPNPPESAGSSLSNSARFRRMLRPSHQHTAFSAALLSMTAIMLSRVIGYLREVYIAWSFGASRVTDAYVAAFQIPDFLAYLVAGGTASITFISIYTRFLAQGKEHDAQETFSVIITVMTVALSAGVVITEIFTPQITRLLFHDFTSAQLALCVHLTRILLPAQIFFYVGGVVSAVLLSRRLFLLPVFGPLVYNAFIIVGGIIFSRRLGISSLAYGALAGTFVGPFLINAIGAARIGTGYRVSFDVRNPAFREWIRMSIPLMIGVSLVSADDWILRYFANGSAGAITQINYAKRLIAVPIAVLGQAVSQASLPFFARLFGEKRMQEFGATVNGSIYRIVATSLLATSFMMATALPLIDLVYRMPRGHFRFSDSQETAVYFFWFSISLAFWAAQGLYARAFYAAGNTLTPMIASTLITIASLPLYSALYRSLSGVGLAIASDAGIAANCVAMAFLLERWKLVPTMQLPWKELGKAAVVAIVAGLAGFGIAHRVVINSSRVADVESLALTAITWAGAIAAGLWITKSTLLKELRRNKRTTYHRVAEQQAQESSAGLEA